MRRQSRRDRNTITCGRSPPRLFDKLKLAADEKRLALSEMVRQCVDIALNGA